MQAIQEAFRECMAELFGDEPRTPAQITQTVRVFLAGWTECLRGRDDHDSLLLLAGELNRIAKDDWRPGPEWRWWKLPGEAA